MSDFYILDRQDSPDAEKTLAKWVPNETEWRKVSCTVEPDLHFGIRERTTPLSVSLPNSKPGDFVWTALGECLINENVSQFFRENEFTGYKAAQAKVRFPKILQSLGRFWELVVTGSAGLASGVKILSSCPGCDLQRYSQIRDPETVVNEANWDGSDFFRVQPISGWIFVTERVIRALSHQHFTGWLARPLNTMRNSFDNAIPADDDSLPEGNKMLIP